MNVFSCSGENVRFFLFFQQLDVIFKLKNAINLKVYLERITRLKENFGSCKTGRYFLEKTEPIWDSLTQCIYRKSSILREMLKNSDSSIPEGYRRLYEQASDEVATKRTPNMYKEIDISFLKKFVGQ